MLQERVAHYYWKLVAVEIFNKQEQTRLEEVGAHELTQCR
jgi:hypothetical protein